MMKHLFPIFLAILTLQACKEEPKQEQAAAAAAVHEDGSVPLDTPGETSDGIFETVSAVDSLTGQVYQRQRPLNPISTAISPNPIKKTDPVKPAYNRPNPQTPQESRVVRILTNNYWAVWALVKIGDVPANVQNQGTWFKFKDDGSYEYGLYEKKIASGAWSFDGQKGTLLLDSELLGDDREWTIKIGSTENVMVWVGTDRFATSNIQMKLQNYLFAPKTRDDMGYD